MKNSAKMTLCTFKKAEDQQAYVEIQKSFSTGISWRLCFFFSLPKNIFYFDDSIKIDGLLFLLIP